LISPTNPSCYLSCDTKPSILGFTLHSFENNTHSAKRTKVDGIGPGDTISSRLESHGYQNIDELAANINEVVSSISSASSNQSLYGAAKFQATFKEVISREIVQNSDALVRGPSGTQAIKEEDGAKSDPLDGTARSSQVVLTLHGGQGGRQLFSSLRQPTNADTLDPLLFEPPTSLREAALPNGISTTTIVPVHSTTSKVKGAKVRTLGDLCPAPANLATIDPPKPSTLTSTRGASVGWYKPDALSLPQKKTGGRDTYPNQNLSSGQWLTYNVPPSAVSQNSGEKRKQRDRALSTGETNPERSEEDMERTRIQQEAYQQTRDQELYKSVFSSFAPSYDNSAAVVPQQLKGQLWWDKVRQSKQYSQPLAEDLEAFEDIDEGVLVEEGVDRETEDRLMQEAVDAFDERAHKLSITDLNSKSFKANGHLSGDKTENETEEILDEVSDLLQTLYSYQRVRNMSLATTTQTSAGQNKPLTELSGTPTNPSEAEVNIYKMLKDQLTILISQLPPYAVAKLNSDQLGELNISRKITIEMPQHKGLISDDTAKPAQTAINGVSTPSMRAPNVTNNRATPYQPPSSTPHRNSYSAARPGASTYYPPNRTPAPTSYSTYTQHGTVPRNYAQYNQQGTPSQTPQYTNNNSRALTAQNGYLPNGMSPIPPRPMQQQQPPRPSMVQYPQQRPPSNSGYPVGSQMAGGRSSSPQNPPHAQGYPNQPHLSTYAQYGQGSPQRPMTNLETMTGTVGQHLQLSPQEQAQLMARQKWQLAQQHQRAGSGTTHAMNGQSPVRPHSNGTPLPQTSASPTPQSVNGV
jgi:hypothetical protein